MKALVKANTVTSHAKTVRDLKSFDIDELRRLFTGDDGSLLFVQAGDYVTFKGISLRTQDDNDGLPASGWTHQFKICAAEIGDAENPDIVRKTYAGFTVWNVDWLEQNFDEIRGRAQSSKQQKNFW